MPNRKEEERSNGHTVQVQGSVQLKKWNVPMCTCPNIEVEIDVTDRSPFFIRPNHVKDEDKALIDKEMKCMCYLGILKEGFWLTLAQSCWLAVNLHKAKK